MITFAQPPWTKQRQYGELQVGLEVIPSIAHRLKRVQEV